MRKIGLDPGFGNLSVAEVRKGKVATVTVASVVGIGSTDIGALNLAGVSRARRSDVPHTVGFEGIDYLVGGRVADYATPIERMDFNRFTDSPELRALLYLALHGLINGGESEIGLVVGLPVEVLQDKAMAAQVERDMTGWLRGWHHFSVDGQPASAHVVACKVDVAQPLASWFDWGMDEAGVWVRGQAGLKAPTLIIDQGFNTLDMISVEAGRISNRYTGGDTLGMRRAAEGVQDLIRRRHGVSMSLHEADDLVRSVIGKGSAQIYVGGQPADVTKEVSQSLTTLAGQVVRFVERKAGNGNRFNILLTGGGAIALGPALQKEYPNSTILDDPVLANARGLAKLAQREGVLA